MVDIEWVLFCGVGVVEHEAAELFNLTHGHSDFLCPVCVELVAQGSTFVGLDLLDEFLVVAVGISALGTKAGEGERGELIFLVHLFL